MRNVFGSTAGLSRIVKRILGENLVFPTIYRRKLIEAMGARVHPMPNDSVTKKNPEDVSLNVLKSQALEGEFPE